MHRLEATVKESGDVLVTRRRHTLKAAVAGFGYLDLKNGAKIIGSMREGLSRLHFLAACTDVCIVVEGPIGCGKTTLVQTYAESQGYHYGDNLVIIHLGEQIDSKMLLGTYTSTSNPGEFIWLPGILTKAVTHGKWVILEDIDRAPSDVVSTLLPLVKERELVIPGYSQPMQAASHFKLFLTQRYAEEKKNAISVHSRVLQQHCAVLQLSTFTQDEIKQVVVKQYPHLQSACERLLSTCSSSVRLHLRHILKFCKRISTHVHDGHVSSMEDLLLELIDCFGGHLSSENRISLSMEFRPICGGIAKEKVEQLCMKRKPLLQVTPTTLTVGRAYLHYTTTKELPRVYYAHTRSSLTLLESVCRCVQMNEPVLLVGETGVGKTATLDYLSKITGNKLVIVNMSQQTESSDLLGGFKPMQVTQFLAPVREEFEQLFHSTFSMKQNAQFLSSLQVCYAQKQWKKWFRLMLHSQESALKRVKGEKGNGKTSLYAQWTTLGKKLRKLRKQLQKPQAALAFAFVEGTLVEAVQRGWWVLLDEINLASPETLQCLSSLLEDSQGSFVVTERGDSKPVVRDPNFRLFCCMNPATDVGKRQLPFIIRNRFTEFFVDEPQSTSDLALLVMSYLKSTSPSAALVDGIISLYRAIKELAGSRLQDGTGKKPNYSLRSLCRALLYAASNQCGTLLRSLYEGFCMAFLTELRQDHHQLVITLIKQYLGISASYISASISQPKGPGFINVEGFWLAVGSEATEASPDYVLTESVKKNLRNLARVVSARCHPVLLQGPTSSGKTSLVQYLAKLTGHKCLRINNHEHTDLQEYVGMYTANNQGQLVFQEGVLVNAMRKGYWIILDELNLAPTDVLEALNRVLDDNRELFIPETQQVVKAHSNFLLFGTQNPPGHYGGRKVLSRAFRNRFIELHYDDIPTAELVTILEKRSKLPQSYAKKMVSVLRDLQQRRSSSGIFAGKYGLITLRDLFRWAERYRSSQSVSIFSDWEQQLAEDGYMLLGGRQRNFSEEAVILEVISKNFKRTVIPSKLFGYDGGVGSLASKQTLEVIKVPLPSEFCHLVWTPELLRMAVLVHRATQFKEPVLLVGNTGCGKTTICQILASIMGRKFYSINCHMHTEAADFLGGLRPVRNRSTLEVSHETAMFEWVDGVVLEAMKEGGCLLIDEISLAEDAVLERLNSLLEPERKLLVSERSRPEDEVYELTAKEEFVFMATMNPGGDFGKKELSPALRNRFVEIWCPAFSARESFEMIILHNLKPDLKCPHSGGILWSNLMLDVMDWLQKLVLSTRTAFSIRDLLTWVKFMNITAPPLTPAEAFFHGANMVFLDAMGSEDQSVAEHRQRITAFIHAQLERQGVNLVLKEYVCQEMNCTDKRLFGIHPFYIEKGHLEGTALQSYSLKAPGPHANAYRLLRSMQLGRPLLLEGAPGVGKTSLVIALAKASGHSISRINLSEHTDISDLFGSDLPVEGGKGVNFAWRDGPLLRALKNGDWVLLDEMNLASQSVLEGLNACLDHRGEIYIPELGMTFKVQPGTRLFACQNPLQQGGGRKGLPKSFVNRFTQVYIDVLTANDLLFITSTLYPSFDPDMLKKMITFNSKVASLTADSGSGLWEFNLRDVLRWCELLQTHQTSGPKKPEILMSLVYLSRLRSKEMKRKVQVVFLDVFECSELEDGLYYPPMPLGSYFHVSKEEVQVGHCVLKRENHYSVSEASVPPLMPLYCQMPVLEALMTCVKMGWMAILVGSSSAGKYSTISTLAQLTGHKLLHFPMNSDTDTTELLGGFEQLNFGRHCCNLASAMLDGAICFQTSVMRLLMEGQTQETSVLQGYADTLSTLVTNLKENFSPAVCIEDSSREKLTGWCDELEETLKQLKSMSDVPGLHLSHDWEEVSQELQHLASRVQESDITGQFEWVDSVLVRALKYGHWLLISNANFCSPSVLDRLNPLLEPNGLLSIDERGIVGDTVPTIIPHPKFRLFLTMNPSHGEISRAMRNRGIEICILPEDSISAIKCQKEDWVNLLAGCGISESEIIHRLLEMCLKHVTNKAASVSHALAILPDCNTATIEFRQQLQAREFDDIAPFSLSVDSPRISPKQVQHAAKCYQFLCNSGHEDPLTTTARMILDVNVSVKLEIRKQEFPKYREPISVLDYILHPGESAVLRDVTPVLQCLTKQMKELGNGTHISETSKLSTSLEMFVSSATVEDYTIRLSLLEQLESLLCNSCHIVVELRASTAALKAVMEHPNVLSIHHKLKQFGSCADGLIATSNPHLPCVIQQENLLIKAEWVHLLARIVALHTTIQQHSQLANCGDGRMSVIQLSYQTHTGVLPLENVPHPSLASLYPVLHALCKDLLESVNFNEVTSLEDLQKSMDWIAVFVRMCMDPGCLLSHLAVAWSLFSGKCLKPLICQHSNLCISQALLKNLENLECITAEGRLSGSLRAVLGHPSPPCSQDIVSQQALIIGRDLELREQRETKLPFFILFNEPLNGRRLLCQAICRVYGMEVQNAEMEVDTILEGRRYPIQGATPTASLQSNIRHPAFLASAVHPALYCLKHLAIELLSGSVYEVSLQRQSEVRALVAYCLQLSFVGLHELEPLVVWQECCAEQLEENVNMCSFLLSMLPRILESCCTGFNVCSTSLPLLEQPEQWETVLPPLSESVCTRMAFHLLALSDDDEASNPEKVPTLTIGNFLSKKEQLKTLLQHIWLHGFCEVYNQSSNVWLESKLTSALLKWFLHAIRKSVMDGTEQSVKQDAMEEKSFPNDTSSFQLAVNELLSLDCIPEAWKDAEPHLIVAHRELANTKSLLCCESQLNSLFELQLLCSLSSARVHLGVAMGLILCPPPVDPVSVAAVHYQYYQQLKNYTSQLLDTCDCHYQMMVGSRIREQCMDASGAKADPIPHVGTSLFVSALFKREKFWTEALQMIPTSPVKRLDEAKYSSLVSLCIDIMKTLCSSTRIKMILTAAGGVKDDPSALQKVIFWSKAITSALEKMKENFKTFPDIVEPFTMAIQQVVIGVHSLAWITAHKANPLQDAIGHIAQFPFFTPTSQGYLELFKKMTGIATSSIQGISQEQQHQVQKKLIQVAAGICAYSVDFLSDTSLSWRDAVSSFLELCWSLWLQADEQARLRVKEEESLYRYKEKTHHISVTEDAAEDEQLNTLFPSYDREFLTELEVLDEQDEQESEPSLGEDYDGANQQQPIASLTTTPHETIVFSTEEMDEICSVHLLLYSKSYITQLASLKESSTFPIQDAYHLAGSLYRIASSLPGMSADYYLMGSHARMCKAVLCGLESQSAGKMPFNIHRDSLPLEAQKVLPILTEIQNRVQELLNEWPDHPVLQQINRACEKVLLLGVNEPLMKILSGLEYVLKKAQSILQGFSQLASTIHSEVLQFQPEVLVKIFIECLVEAEQDWEAYASSGVSLYSQLEALTQLILDWRRLELNSWKNLLAFCAVEVRISTAKWWFHFYSLCKSQIDKEDTSSGSDDFISAVQKFMETSTLGEFPRRLFILDAFKVDMLEKGHNNVACILSNALSFYGQFLHATDSSIQQLARPLQKEFKEFLSILRWNDSNYWALKAATEKSHRNLVKFINKYKAILNQPVLPLLTDSSLERETEEEDSVGTESRLEQLLRADTHLNKFEQTMSYQHKSSDEVSVVILSERETLEISGSDALNRMKELVHNFKSAALCCKWSVALDRFTGDLITTMNDIQSTEFLKGLEGDKRKAAIKLSKVQKQKAVGDLFKALRQQGLSYRRGVQFTKNFRVVAFRLPAPQPCTEDAESLWEDMQKYYYLCVARMAGLEAALVNPSKELSVGQISRCKGYASQLMSLVCDQRAVLDKAVDDSSSIMHAVERLHLVIKTEARFVPPNEFGQWQSTLCSNLEQCLWAVSSFAELIATMPEHLDFSLTPLNRSNLPPIVATGDRTLASTALSALESHLTELKELYAAVVKRERQWANFISHFATMYEVDELKKGFLTVEKFSVSIGDVLSLTMGEQKRLGMLEFFGSLQKQLESSCKNFFHWASTVTNSPIHETSSLEGLSYQEQANQLMKVMLLGMQRVMIKHQDNCNAFENREGGQEDFMYCKRLHLFVLQNLEDFKCTEVLQELQFLLRMTPKQVSTFNDVSKIVSAVYPLLCRHVSLHEKLVFDLMIAHRTMCKLLSILLQTFAMLVSKGFCTPPEFTETENGSEATEFVDIEAGGFDEGEGNKNVSSEVNPENLDATQSQSSKQQEEENREQQGEGEEDAVEMPEDFEGALEDVERDGEQGEESEESEGEEDPDRQMGQLGEGEAEQLDRNMWAPEEEEDQVSSPENQEQGGGTTVEDETRMVAKEDSQGLKESGESPEEERLGEESLEDRELGEGEGDDETREPNTDFQEQSDPAKDEDMDLGDLNLDDGEDGGADDESVVEETLQSPSGAEEEGKEGDGEDTQMEGEVLQGSDAEEEEEKSQNDKIYASETMDISTYTGVEPSTAEPNTTSSELKDSEDGTEGQHSDTTSSAAGGRSTESSSAAQPNEPLEETRGSSQRKLHSRSHDDRSLADSEERAIKRPRLMDSHLMPPNKDDIHQQKKESTLYQHVKDSQEHDAVAWDAAPLNQQGLPLKPLEESGPESGSEEGVEDTALEEPSRHSASDQPPQQLVSGEVATDSTVPMELESEDQEAEEGERGAKERQSLPGESFYATGKMLFLQQKQLDQDALRESLKTDVAVLHSKEQSLDASELWVKYEELTSALSQMLCEELRLILQPTRAAQLKGDFRTGKRLNMRRIIPYIASNFQNNRIWLRRAKPSKREYQILIAVDDSSSMNENECNQMAYESMALISNALSRLDCGQLGICRFGENVEVLHPLDQPFSTAAGGHILQHLTFTQTKTNFVQLLQAAESLFAKGLAHSSGSHSSPDISQLLVVLSDGRGVFADGTLAVETAVRRLNELGVFTVFVILDSLSKDSIVDIKVPTFIPGKPPVIKSYLETFPFPFYIVLRDVKILPSVMGQALRQWFELVSSKNVM